MMRVSVYSRLGVMGLLLLTGLTLSGCSKDAPTSADVAPEGGAAVKNNPEGGVALKNKGGNNTRDVSLIPAPPGVKTGIEGGKK